MRQGDAESVGGLAPALAFSQKLRQGSRCFSARRVGRDGLPECRFGGGVVTGVAQGITRYESKFGGIQGACGIGEVGRFVIRRPEKLISQD
nr:hypothetical protein [Skermanella pratensis]